MTANFISVINDESEDALSLEEIKGGVKTYGIFGCCFINSHCNENNKEEDLKEKDDEKTIISDELDKLLKK